MNNKCRGCKDVKVCKIRHGFKDLCRQLPPRFLPQKVFKKDSEGVLLESYQGKNMTVGSIQPHNEWGQVVERRKGRIGKQETAALKMRSRRTPRRSSTRSSAKSALLDDSKYVPDSALSWDPEAHEDKVGGWIPEDEPELPPLKPTRCRVISGRKTSPFSLKLETEPMYPSGRPEVTKKQQRERIHVAQLRQICRKHLKNHPDQKLTLPIEDWLLLNKHGGVSPPSSPGEWHKPQTHHTNINLY